MTALAAQLLRHEGSSATAYADTRGYLTIGAGRLCDPRKPGSGLSATEIGALLANDIARITREVDTAFPWTRTLSTTRREVLLNMGFNLGIGGLAKFVKMLAQVQCGKYSAAAEEMLASRWAVQVRGRADELAELMREG